RVARLLAPPMHAAILIEHVNSPPAAAPRLPKPKRKGFSVNTDPRAAPPPANRALPRWAVKPVRLLTTAELAEALEYLERNRPEDDVLGRALAGPPRPPRSGAGP